MAKVLNKRGRVKLPDNAVYVGRPSKWGNPFVIDPTKPGDRERVIKKYEEWLLNESGLDPTELRGKDLVCWCAPKPCHADVLLRLANG